MCAKRNPKHKHDTLTQTMTVRKLESHFYGINISDLIKVRYTNDSGKKMHDVEILYNLNMFHS